MEHFQVNLSKITRSCLQKIELCQQKESVLWIHFEDIDDGLLRCFYAHENRTFLNKSKLAFAAEDMVKLKKVLNKTDLIEMRNGYRIKTKWRFYKLPNLTVFAALHKEEPIGCRDAVLPEPFLKNQRVNSLTFMEIIEQKNIDIL